MLFSVTERGVFKRCPRKALLTSKNGRNLEPILPPLSLSVGSLVHRAHQIWIISDGASTLHDCALAASVEMRDRLIDRYQAQVGTAPSATELETTYEAVHFAMTMCDNYEKYWKTPLPPDYKMISAEQTIRAAVPGSSHFLEGRLDGLMQHIPTGRLTILERKTYNQRPKEAALRSNDQFLAYDWLVRQLGFNAHLGVRVAYDGMWRRDRVPRGRTFDDLFARYLLPERNEHERAEFEAFLPRELDMMASIYGEPSRAYTNRRWEGCYDCGVEDLCYAMSRGEDTSGLLQFKYTERQDNESEPTDDSSE